MDGIAVVGGTIDGTSQASAFAQPITGDHVLTQINGYFTTTVAQALVGTTVTGTVQLWTSPTPDNTFTPVPGAQCTLAPALTGVVGIGTVSNCETTGLSIPLTDGTQAILVVSTTATGVSLIDVTTGFWSSGLTLS